MLTSRLSLTSHCIRLVSVHSERVSIFTCTTSNVSHTHPTNTFRSVAYVRRCARNALDAREAEQHSTHASFQSICFDCFAGQLAVCATRFSCSFTALAVDVSLSIDNDNIAVSFREPSAECVTTSSLWATCCCCCLKRLFFRNERKHSVTNANMRRKRETRK